MPSIEKLKSGKYRIRQMVNGKLHLLTIDHMPGKNELRDITAKMVRDNDDRPAHITFRRAAERYVDSKCNVISPATVREYRLTIGRLPDFLLDMRLGDITNPILQRIINQYAAGRSPKTVRNTYGFITAVLGFSRPAFRPSITLPARRDPDFYVPEQDDVRRILDHARGGAYEVPLWLACFGLRRSEICALTLDDLDGTTLTINKALVADSRKQWVVKTTKTASSVRTITIPARIADLIRAQGYVYHGHPDNINKYLERTEAVLGIEHFSLHKLRHYFAASARNIMSDSYVEEAGGWRPGSQVMRKVYAYAEKKKSAEAKQAFSDSMAKLFD